MQEVFCYNLQSWQNELSTYKNNATKGKPRMRKFFLAFAALFMFAAGAQAQSLNEKTDVYVGYQFVRVNPDVQQPTFRFDNTSDSHGVNGAVTYYFGDKNVGLTGELAANFDGGRQDSSLVTALTGVTVKARSNKTFQPFARGLVGVNRTRAANEQLSNIFDRSDVNGAFALGVGLDAKVSKNVSIRVAQVDYLNTGAFGERQHNLRLGAGIVF